MRIEVKGRNLPVSDDSVSTWTSAFGRSHGKSRSWPSSRSRCSRSATRAIADSQVAEATLHLKGVTLRARDRFAGHRSLDQPVRGRASRASQAPSREAPQATPGSRAPSSRRPRSPHRRSRITSPAASAALVRGGRGGPRGRPRGGARGQRPGHGGGREPPCPRQSADRRARPRPRGTASGRVPFGARIRVHPR